LSRKTSEKAKLALLISRRAEGSQ